MTPLYPDGYWPPIEVLRQKRIDPVVAMDRDAGQAVQQRECTVVRGPVRLTARFE